MDALVNIPAGIVCGRSMLTALLLEAEIPALMRNGVLEAMGGQLDFASNVWAFRRTGVDVPLEVNGIGDSVLRVASFVKGRKKSVGGPTISASYFQSASSKTRSN